MDLNQLTIAQASQQLRNGFLTSEALVKYYLARIKTLNPKLNAFITIIEARALETAAILDAELKAGKDRGKLHGIPIIIKDNIDTAGINTSVGSKIFVERIPITNATIVEKLQATGAIILGKTKLTELAADVSGRNQFYGDTCNVWNLKHSPGGSSSGTGSAIAARLCLGGIGTDTGGSIRIPASWSGIVGLRPTHGLVSLNGIFPRAFSFDTVGPMTNCVEDAAILLDAIAEPNTSNINNLHQGIKGLRLGVIKNFTFRGVDSEVAQAVQRAIALFKAQGTEIITLENHYLETEFDESIYSNIAIYEFYQALKEQDIIDPNLFGTKVQSELAKGIKISQAIYEKSQKTRKIQTEQFLEIFTQVDAVLTPTTPIVAPLLTADAKTFQFSRRFILPFSFAGVPSISVPCGFSENHLPIGLQIIGNRFSESLILRIAAALESAINFSKDSPL